MKTKSSSVPIILASTSPRRLDLLSEVGLNVLVQAPTADESLVRGESPRAMVRRLAREKAHSLVAPVAARHGEALIIAADTTVVAPDGKTIFGKPRNAREARRMLTTIAGKTHTVFTGYCILALSHRSAEELVRVVRSQVTLRKLSRTDIARYVATGEPMDKAGAYAAQGIGMALIESIRGSYTNVVGLPISQLLEDLELHFGVPLLAAAPRKGKK